jgi:DNA-binding winged helix-turn-helix (wHTH) protein/tetratricopeptide (TPR) repeat protein/TolB-like protein
MAPAPVLKDPIKSPENFLLERMSRQEKGFYEFGSFRLDPVKRVLRRGEDLVPLTPKAFSTLLALVERQGEVVEKDTLIQLVWPDTFITEATLTQNVFRLRKALGEGAGDHRFIVTVPGRGYSFVAEVHRVEPEPPPPPTPAPAASGTLAMSAVAAIAAIVEAPEIPVAEAPEAVSTGPEAPHARGLVSAGLAGGLLLLAVGLLFLRAGPRPPAAAAIPSRALSAVSLRRSVAVLGFRNLSGRKEAAWLSTALAEMFTVELGVGEKLQTLSGDAVARTRMDLNLQDVENLSPTTLARIRAVLGCDVVLLGSFLDLGDQAGGKVRVDLRLQDTATGETLAVATRTRTEAELFEMVSDLGQELRQDLGGGGVPREQSVTARASFPARHAPRLYSEGLQSLRTLDTLAALDYLQQATAAEPSFPLAHANLAMAWSSLGYDTKAEEESKRALDLAASLSREDRLLVEGLHEETRKNWPQAVEIYKTLWTFFPDDPEHGLRLARTQISAGQAKDALATVATLRRMPPPQSSDPRLDLTEAEAAAALSDFRRQAALAAQAVRRGEILGARLLLARALQMQASAARVLGKPAEALASVQQAEAIFSAVGDRRGIADSLFDTASLLKDQGDLAGAQRLDEKALAIYRETGNQRGRLRVERHLGNLTALLGDLKEAKRHLANAVAISTEINDRMERSFALTTLANLQQSEGELTAAARTLNENLASFRAIGSPEGEGASHVGLSAVLREQGNLAESRRHADTALRVLREIGHSRGTGFALAKLGILLVDQGDLEGAQAAYRELGEMARTTGLRNLRADAAMGFGLLQRLQGNLAAAHKSQAEALLLREQSHDRYDLAESRLAMAELALEEGDAAAAEQNARSAAAELHALHIRDTEALARAALARALQAQGQTDPAQQSLREALELTAKSEGRRARLTVAVVAGRVAADSGRIDEARRTLTAARDEARNLGLWLQRLDATLALGQLELRQGDRRVGEILLESLRREAAGKGFRLTADRAAALLKEGAPRPTSRRGA